MCVRSVLPTLRAALCSNATACNALGSMHMADTARRARGSSSIIGIHAPRAVAPDPTMSAYFAAPTIAWRRSTNMGAPRSSQLLLTGNRLREALVAAK